MRLRQSILHVVALSLAVVACAPIARAPVPGVRLAGPPQLAGPAEISSPGGVAAVAVTPFVPARREAPALSAAAALVIDSVTGEVLLERAADEPRAMASTTKIMTALVALEQVPESELDVPFAVGRMAPRPDETVMGLRSGERVTVRQLLYGAMLPSGNDAADALAVRVAGSIEGFVGLMNGKAAALGLSQTRFANPSGLDQEGHYSTARDLARLAAEAMAHPALAKIAGERLHVEPRLDGAGAEWQLINQSLPMHYYPGVTGVKPGWTPDAGTCQVVSVTLEGRSVIVVLLNTEPAARDLVRILDWHLGTTSVLAPPDHERTIVRGVSEDGQPWTYFAVNHQRVIGELEMLQAA